MEQPSTSEAPLSAPPTGAPAAPATMTKPAGGPQPAPDVASHQGQVAGDAAAAAAAATATAGAEADVIVISDSDSDQANGNQEEGEDELDWQERIWEALEVRSP